MVQSTFSSLIEGRLDSHYCAFRKWTRFWLPGNKLVRIQIEYKTTLFEDIKVIDLSIVLWTSNHSLYILVQALVWNAAGKKPASCKPNALLVLTMANVRSKDMTFLNSDQLSLHYFSFHEESVWHISMVAYLCLAYNIFGRTQRYHQKTPNY